LIREKRENAYCYYSLDVENIQHLRETLFADNHFSLPARKEGRAQVLANFFQDERLVNIPKERAKRRIVLEEIGRSFAWGCLYDEREVNAILKQCYDDAASLRHLMIDEQIMMREGGRYWLVRPNDQSETEKADN
jgi:hypothetical protein